MPPGLYMTSSSMSDNRYNNRNRTIKRRRRKRSFRRRFWRFVKSGRFMVSLFALLIIIIFGVTATIAIRAVHSKLTKDKELEEAAIEEIVEAEEEEIEELPPVDPEVASFAPGYAFIRNDSTQTLPEFLEDGSGSSVVSQYALLVDVDTNEVIAERSGSEVINPASMTKILTLLVAVENIDDYSDTYKITDEITQYTYDHDCSVVGFDPKEKVTVEDLLYGTILPSGADAVLGLCDYVAGGQEAFVELMNERVEELGISDTAHFTNATGLYDENHHCTCEDMAAIMKAALQYEECRKVLYARTYTTSSTKQHPDGILISNWFMRRIEDKPLPGEISGAKTGFVKESGNCAASYLVGNDGHHYICVTGWSRSAWRCIYDHVDIYNGCIDGGETISAQKQEETSGEASEDETEE